MAEVNYIQASPVLASYPEYKNTYIYLTFKVKNSLDWNNPGTGEVRLKRIGRTSNTPVENYFLWNSSDRKWYYNNSGEKVILMQNYNRTPGYDDGVLFGGNPTNVTITERLFDSTISDKYFSSDELSHKLSRYGIFKPAVYSGDLDNETFIIMRYETDSNGDIITLEPNGTTPEMIRLTFDVKTGAEIPTFYLENVRIHAKSNNSSCTSVIYEDVLIDDSNNIKYIDNTYYTITSSVGTGVQTGSIDPLGTIKVKAGNSQTYLMTPATNYKLDKLYVDSVVTVPTTTNPDITYTFNNVDRNGHTINVLYTSSTVYYDVSLNYSDYDGNQFPTNDPDFRPVTNISYSPDSKIESGNRCTITITTIDEYEIKEIVDQDNTTYSFTQNGNVYTCVIQNVSKDLSLDAKLKKIGPFTLQFTTDGNGLIKKSDNTWGTSGEYTNILAGSPLKLYYTPNTDKIIGTVTAIQNESPYVSYTPTITSTYIQVNNIKHNILLNANFNDIPDPSWFSNWMLKMKVIIPSNNYTFSFNISNYTLYDNVNNLIDCNYEYHNPDVPNVMDKNNRFRQRCHPSLFQNPVNPNQFDILFVRSGTYVIALNFLPSQSSQVFSVNSTYSDIISEISYNASTTTFSVQPNIQFNSSSVLQKFEYLNVYRDNEYFNNNIKIEGTGNVNNFEFVSGNSNNYIKQIGNDAIYSSTTQRISCFRNKEIHQWNCDGGQTFAKNVEILEGFVFENARLPIKNLQIGGNTYQNCLYMEMLNQIKGAVFKNISGYNTDNGLNKNVETFIANRPSNVSWKNGSNCVYGNQSSSFASSNIIEGPWANIEGLKKIALNHSTYKYHCFHGIILPSQADIAADPNPTETQKEFNDSTTPYFKLLIKNGNISFDNTIFVEYPGDTKNFYPERVILYLLQSVINDPNKVQGNVFMGKQWGMILPIEHYAYDIYNLPYF